MRTDQHPDDYPDERPSTFPPQLKGTAAVYSKNTDTTYIVDFDKGVCDCKDGRAYRWERKRWLPAPFCSHKMKALASLCTSRPKDAKLLEFYYTQLGRRYNAFVAISAFHKELRRGDVDKALYWATAMIPHRGCNGVVQYMFKTVFEETRDILLGRFLLRLHLQGRAVSELDMQRAVRRYCAAPKKWELPWRRDIFVAEMLGYRRLGQKYGYAVAKDRDIIDASEHEFLKGELLGGFADGDMPRMQTGLKGWYKSKSPEHEHHKVDIFNLLTEILNEEHPNAFKYDEGHAHAIHAYSLDRQRHAGLLKYHDLNAFADALAGETPGTAATLPPAQHKRHTGYPTVKRPKLGDLRTVPLYAQDNHTWHGKALMRAHGQTELRPSAVQSHLDFRMCGAYMGVAWRTLAFEQHGTIDCKWGDVKWAPTWLWGHLDNMWYTWVMCLLSAGLLKALSLFPSAAMLA